MSTMITDCLSCKRTFKTLYSLKKHIRERHVEEDPDFLIPVFKDSSGSIVVLPKSSDELDDQAGYKLWLSGLVERLNATFHPRLPGRWVKIDSHQVLSIYFEYFLSKLQVQVNSVREVCHKQQPCYKTTARRVSYKIYDLEILYNALREHSVVELQPNVLFAANTPCENTSTRSPRSVEEEIAQAKQLAYQPMQHRRRPSSKSVLQVGLGEGRATREIEVIWWPDLYGYTMHGQMTVRLFIEKCTF